MKKLFVLLLSVMMVAAIVPVHAITKNGILGDVPQYKGTITIDGKKDAIYDKGLILDVKEGRDQDRSESTGKLYFLHDGAALYIIFEGKSAYPLGDYNPANVNSNSYKTTALEVMIDWTNAATSNAQTKKYICWYDGQYWAFRDNNKTTDIEYKATVDKANKTFVMEFKCPFREGAAVGKEIGFNSMFDSDKTMGASTTSTRTIAWLYVGVDNNGAQFKNLKLSAKEVAADTTNAAAATTKAAATNAATKTTTAAKTADASVVIAAALVTAAAAAIVLKKRK